MNKKHFFFWLTVAAACVTLFSTCKKDKEDYRDKWVGTYDCERGSFQKKVLVDVTTKEDSVLHIEERGLLEEDGYYRQGVRHDVKIDSEGNFTKISNGGNLSLSGYFYKDSIYILYVYPAPGHTTRFSYEGKKIKSE